MSPSESKFWYTNNYLHFSKHAVPLHLAEWYSSEWLLTGKQNNQHNDNQQNESHQNDTQQNDTRQSVYVTVNWMSLSRITLRNL